MLYYVYFSDAGVPKTGLTLTWEYLVTATNGTDKSANAPSFSEIGGGWYSFNVSYGSSPWDVTTEDLIGVVDGGSILDTADRYRAVSITKRGLALSALTNGVSDETLTIMDDFMGIGYQCTITLQTTGGDAISGATVWMSTSATGSPPFTAPLTTNASGQVTFWLTGTSSTPQNYYIFAAGAGYSYSNDEYITVAGSAANKTVQYGTVASSSSGVSGVTVTDFLTRTITAVRAYADEPTTNAKYSDSTILDYIATTYAEIIQNLQRNKTTQLVCSYSFDYSESQSVYPLPLTAGTIISVGTEETTYESKTFFHSGSWLNEYGTGMTIQEHEIHFQKQYLSDGTTVVVKYLPDGCATLFGGTTSTFDNTAGTLQFETLSVGTRDTRENAYVGSILRILPNSSNEAMQERVITAQSTTSKTYDTFTVTPTFSPVLTGTVAYEICPPFPKAMDNVVALKTALRIVGIEGNQTRYRTLMNEYKDAMRSLTLQAANKNFMEGSHRHRDGFTALRGSRPYRSLLRKRGW